MANTQIFPQQTLVNPLIKPRFCLIFSETFLVEIFDVTENGIELARKVQCT